MFGGAKHRVMRFKNDSQRKAVMSKYNKPSMASKSSTKNDIKNIHRSSESSDSARKRYDIYKRDVNYHMDQQELKQFNRQQRKEIHAEAKEHKRLEKEQQQQDSIGVDQPNNDSGNGKPLNDNTSSNNQ